MPDIVQQLDKVQQRIHHSASKAGRNPDQITLLAVSKTRPIEDLITALDAGQHAFGENYLQEAVEKITAMKQIRPNDMIEWHFIGPIQSNKTSTIAEYFDWVHSVDRLKIAQRLNDQRQSDTPLNICIQVNISNESTKSGVSIENLVELARAIKKLPNLRLRGLMAIPAASATFEQQCQPLRLLKQQFDGLRQQGFELDTLSMGMSGDLEAAIYEGATIVRIGTDIFGARQSK